MGEIACRGFNPAFKPNEKQINAIKGLIVGAFEYGFAGHTGLGCLLPEVDWVWISDNLADANRRMNELIRHGMVWQHEWYGFEDEKVFSFGLTESGEAWACEHLGMPEACNQQAVMKPFIATLNFVRKGEEPKAKQVVKTGRAATVKGTSEWVGQTSYSVAEAKAAVAAAVAAVSAGKLNPRSLAAVKAHITRRTAKVA